MYDVLGNVTEWTTTKWEKAPLGGTDPQGPLEGSGRVLRGAAWDYPAKSVTLWDRAWADEMDSLSTVGFRCVIEVK